VEFEADAQARDVDADRFVVLAVALKDKDEEGGN